LGPVGEARGERGIGDQPCDRRPEPFGIADISQ
jgi:hypothetical protein